MIGRSGERRSGISAQGARHDDDDIYIERDGNGFPRWRREMMMMMMLSDNKKKTQENL